MEIVLAAAAGVAAFVLTVLVCVAARSHVPAVVLGPLLLLAVLAVARLAGILYALPVGVATVLAFDWYFLPPLRDLDTATELVLGLFLAMSVIVWALATTASRRAIASEHARGAIAEEQSALRRVATLVAQAGPPSVVFEAVTREVGLLCNADVARMERYEADGVVTGVAAWSRAPSQFAELAVGTRFTLDGLSIARGVQQTGGPVRVDGFGTDTGQIAQEARAVGIQSSVGCPIVVGGRLWGVIAASRRIEEPFPADTEAQIARFTELVATAVANVQAREELRALADEQAALRRVATLVAGTAPPAAVFAAVAEEAGRLLAADLAHTFRYEPDDTVSAVASWSRQSDHLAVGSRYPLQPSMVTALVRRTGQPARTDTYPPSSPLADEARRLGVRSTVGCPITVEGRLWGLIGVSSSPPESLPADTEARLTDFTELVATAIANAEARAELTASRARIVATTDQPAGGSSATCTTAPSSGWSPWPCGCAPAAAAIPPDEELQQDARRVSPSELERRSGRSARALARHPSGHPVRARPRPGPAHPSPRRVLGPSRALQLGRGPAARADRGGRLLRCRPRPWPTRPSTLAPRWCRSTLTPMTGSCGWRSATTGSGGPTLPVARGWSVSRTGWRPPAARCEWRAVAGRAPGSWSNWGPTPASRRA